MPVNPHHPISANAIDSDRRVLELLSQTFGNVSSAATEIINLEAILNLPKGTEHFVADLHGESEAFNHILRNASGNIKRKVNELFATSPAVFPDILSGEKARISETGERGP